VPTYSYACTECSNRFDAVQAFSDAALTNLPECNGRLRKLFGNVGVVFKGSGFYRTDSRESAKSSATSSSNGSASGLGVHQLLVVGEIQLHLIQLIERFELELVHLGARRGGIELTREVVHGRGQRPSHCSAA